MAPHLKRAGWGRMVTIASGEEVRPSLAGNQANTIAEHALVGPTGKRSWDIGPNRTTAKTVAPGVRYNPRTERQWRACGAKGRRRLAGGAGIRRPSRAEDIAHAALFFASERAGWISGPVLAVDGGRS